MSYLQFRLRQLVQHMWFLPAAFSALAVLTVFIAYSMAGFLPEELPFTMPENGVQAILEILATSLLTVAVFALSTVVSALGAASNTTTPRAVPLIAGDLQAQTSISVFIGAFLFSIVGIIGLSAGLYSEAGRLFLFGVTIVVVILVVAALIRWIGQISAIGRVENTILAVAKATEDALDVLSAHPLLDCSRLEGAGNGQPLNAPRPGYVQHCDTDELQKLAAADGLVVTVLSRPGTYATPMRPLLLVEGQHGEKTKQALIDCFVLGENRTYESDPRYGFVVLGEIADRALSPGVNDPGTAIDVIDTVTRLLLNWTDEGKGGRNDRVFMAPLSPQDVLEDVFRPIARDGAAVVEVAMRLQRSLETLAACKPELANAARWMAKDAMGRSEKAMTAENDIAALRKAADWMD